MKKNITITIIILLILLLIQHRNSNSLFLNYTDFSNSYDQKFDKQDYLSNSLEKNLNLTNIYLNLILTSTGLIEFNDYSDYISELQIPVDFSVTKKDKVTYESNFEYKSNQVSSNISISNNINLYQLVISMQKNSKFCQQCAKLLANDYNSELLSYEIIKYIQFDNKSFMSPNNASMYYFDSTFQQLAGSISLHALISLVLSENNLENTKLFMHANQINISKQDFDNFIINKTF